MHKFKLFVENFLIYGLGGTISKIVPFVMLPIITRLMPDTFYFGLNDISTVIISFGQALAVMGMYDAMFRMFFEKEDVGYKKAICSSAFFFTVITSTILFVLMMFLKDWLADLFFSDRQYANLIMLSAISILIGATNSIVAAPTRMNNKRGTYIIMNTLSPIISYAISIPLLIKGMYVIALPLAGIISAISIEIGFLILNREWFDLKKINKNYIKEMLVIALPLVPNLLIYWIFNSCDRLMIAKILGNEYAGIYAVGGKIGQVSQLIYTAFAGGWQYFSFSTMKENNQVKTTSNIFEYLGLITIIASMAMTALCEILFNILFTGDYIQGTIVAPYLFVAPLMLMLYQVIGNQFIIIKKTWPNALILGIGAIANVLANLILIPIIGIEGAALATVGGYVLSILCCVIVLSKMKLISISLRFLGLTIIYILFMVLWRFVLRDNWLLSFLLAILCSVFGITLYLKDIMSLFQKKE